MPRPKGFYTKDGKVRPISKCITSTGTYQHGIAHLDVPKRVSKHKPIRRLDLKSAMYNVLCKPGIPFELQMGYIVADAIFENWNLINQPLEAYQKNGIEGVVYWNGFYAK